MDLPLCLEDSDDDFKDSKQTGRILFGREVQTNLDWFLDIANNNDWFFLKFFFERFLSET